MDTNPCIQFSFMWSCLWECITPKDNTFDMHLNTVPKSMVSTLSWKWLREHPGTNKRVYKPTNSRIIIDRRWKKTVVCIKHKFASLIGLVFLIKFYSKSNVYSADTIISSFYTKSCINMDCKLWIPNFNIKWQYITL